MKDSEICGVYCNCTAFKTSKGRKNISIRTKMEAKGPRETKVRGLEL